MLVLGGSAFQAPTRGLGNVKSGRFGEYGLERLERIFLASLDANVNLIGADKGVHSLEFTPKN